MRHRLSYSRQTKVAQHLHDSTVSLSRWPTTSDRHAKSETVPPHRRPPHQKNPNELPRMGHLTFFKELFFLFSSLLGKGTLWDLSLPVTLALCGLCLYFVHAPNFPSPNLGLSCEVQPYAPLLKPPSVYRPWTKIRSLQKGLAGEGWRLIGLSRRLAATESIAVQWVLMAPHPMSSPFDNGFVCIVRPCAPLKNGTPLFVPWVTMGGPTHSWVGPPISSTH